MSVLPIAVAQLVFYANANEDLTTEQLHELVIGIEDPEQFKKLLFNAIVGYNRHYAEKYGSVNNQPFNNVEHWLDEGLL